MGAGRMTVGTRPCPALQVAGEARVVGEVQAETPSVCGTALHCDTGTRGSKEHQGGSLNPLRKEETPISHPRRIALSVSTLSGSNRPTNA